MKDVAAVTQEGAAKAGLVDALVEPAMAVFWHAIGLDQPQRVVAVEILEDRRDIFLRACLPGFNDPGIRCAIEALPCKRWRLYTGRA